MRVRSLKPSPDCDIFCCGVVCIVRVFNQRVSEPTDQTCSIHRMLFEGELFRTQEQLLPLRLSFTQLL